MGQDEAPYQISRSEVILLWPPLRSNWQAIMFYSCDLLFFRALILEAEERRAAGPLPRCANVEQFYNADQRGPIVVSVGLHSALL